MTASIVDTELKDKSSPKSGRASRVRYNVETRFWICALMFIAMFFIASSIGSGWVLFLAAAVLCSCALSILLPLLALKGLAVSISGPDQLSAGDEVHLLLKANYPSWLSALTRWMIFQAKPNKKYIYSSAEPETVLIEEVAQGALISLSCPGLKRGIRAFPPVEISTSFPFGMVWVSALFEADERLCVFPKIENVEGKFLYRLRSGTYVPGDAQESTAGFQSCAARGVRNYVRGDSRRFIHWSLSARHGHLMVKELENEGLPAFDLLFDAAAPWANDEQFELAVSAAASILELGHTLGIHPDLFILEKPFVSGDQLGQRSTDIDQQLYKLAELEYKNSKTGTGKGKNELTQVSDPAAFEERQKAVLLISPLVRQENSGEFVEYSHSKRSSVFLLSVSSLPSASLSPMNSNEFILARAEDFSDL